MVDSTHHPVVVVGAGPVGLSLAIDLAQRGIRVLLLDRDGILTQGSRAICFAKRTLEIFDRLGCGERMVAKGVSWNVGRVFFGTDLVYRFDLLPEDGHERPAFINLQQYHVERFLADRAAELPAIETRWNHAVVGVDVQPGCTTLDVDTPDGPRTLTTDWVVACDGSRSTLRRLLGSESAGRTFRDRFLIADIRLVGDAASLPAERWFWFDPPFHPGQSVLLHMQPDNIWRVDFQLGWDADPDAEKRPENIAPRVRALFDHAGLPDVGFELVWSSVYTFACQRMPAFRHGRVLFAGDAAHGVSPFGARGANSGIQDADNLGWKLAAVVSGLAADTLLDSYAGEREAAADENIRASTRSTDFITPKSEISRLFRDAVLQLAPRHAFARTLVNSGRLSTPTTMSGSTLNTPDDSRFAGRAEPGMPAIDAPVRSPDGGDSWLLRHLGGGFTALLGAGRDTARFATELRRSGGGLTLLVVGSADDDGATLIDRDGAVADRYDLRPGTLVLLRPDHHVCGRFRAPTVAAVRQAMARAMAVH